MRKILNLFQTKQKQPWNHNLKPRTQTTVYPKGKPVKSLTGIGEWYGLQENNQLKPIK